MFFNNLVNQPTTTQAKGIPLITIDEYEASWSRQDGAFEYRHHTQTGEVSLGDALTELVQMFDPNVGVTVESIEDYKIVITNSYGLIHKGLNTPADDGIPARDIYNPYGYAIVFSYTGDIGVSGIDGGYGFNLFANVVWTELHRWPERRGKEVQAMFEAYEAEQLAVKA